MLKNVNFLVSCLILVIVIFVIQSCDDSSTDVCSNKQKVEKTATLSAGGPITYSLVTSDAKKDCQAEFDLYFAWADTDKRKENSDKPLLTWLFRIYPGFFYFPADQAVMVEKDDGYWWHASVQDAKDVDEEFVQYEIKCTLSGINDIIIEGEIYYNPYETIE